MRFLCVVCVLVLSATASPSTPLHARLGSTRRTLDALLALSSVCCGFDFPAVEDMDLASPNELYALQMSGDLDFNSFCALRHHIYKVGRLRTSLHLLCFYINFRRPWWKDCVVLCILLACMTEASLKLEDAMLRGRPMEMAVQAFACEWLLASCTGYHIDNSIPRLLTSIVSSGSHAGPAYGESRDKHFADH